MRKTPERISKKYRLFLAPLIAAFPVAVLCILVITCALHSDGTTYSLGFLTYAGKFKYNDVHFLGLSVYWILMLTGLTLACLLAASPRRRAQYGFRAGLAVVFTILAALQGIIGLKVLYAIERVVRNGSWKELSFRGQSLFGSLYSSVVLVPLLALIFRKRARDMLDFIAPTWLLMLIFTRLGCFQSGCCGGRLMFFGDAPLSLPVQLFEVICDLLILSFCLWLDRPGKAPASRGRDIYPIMLILYGPSRFLLELLRYNEPFVLGLTGAQLHSIFFFVIGVIWFVCSRGKESLKKSAGAAEATAKAHR